MIAYPASQYSLLIGLVLTLQAINVSCAEVCSYYPYYPQNLTSITIECPSECCTTNGYPTSPDQTCCYLESSSQSDSSYLFVIIPVCVVSITLGICVFCMVKNRRCLTNWFKPEKPVTNMDYQDVISIRSEQFNGISLILENPDVYEDIEASAPGPLHSASPPSVRPPMYNEVILKPESNLPPEYLALAELKKELAGSTSNNTTSESDDTSFVPPSYKNLEK